MKRDNPMVRAGTAEHPIKKIPRHQEPASSAKFPREKTYWEERSPIAVSAEHPVPMPHSHITEAQRFH